MNNFDGIRFNGEFRDYQKAVLERTSKHIKDGKIHIVAAPGSGKTVLGLELIRRLGGRALVFSPSVTIRQQWGERFAERFLPAGKGIDGYVSYDLKSPSLITSVTYQALHAAVTRERLAPDIGDGDDTALEDEKSEDFSDFDIYSFLARSGIKTICLDEAHHLKSEWQKALEAFIAAVEGKLTVISLTATPPYDSTPAEWGRYISLCGEIDEEIFVPQLIAQKNLCPHQDFVYFSYPTEDESRLSQEYKTKGNMAAREILQSELPKELMSACGIEKGSVKSEELILEHTAEFTSLFSCAQYAGLSVPRDALNAACGGDSPPACSIRTAETAFNFVLDNPAIFSKPLCEKLRAALAQNGLIDRRKVCLVSTEKIDRQLAASVGKLGSIERIVQSESANLGEGLRMLVLTDYIKRDLLKLVGTDGTLSALGAVPVFEAVRRSAPRVRTALLSGTLVLVPDSSLKELGVIAASMGLIINCRHIENTFHSELVVSGSNKNKVSLLTEAFRRGLINVLVGTKSLLGEGWDSPCINSLILASFVGSFMLSNQMRGRAIRTDSGNPDKVADIWHLTTVEPEFGDAPGGLFSDGEAEDSSHLSGSDFDTLKRRFDCFLAPAYHSDVIESGLDRLDNLVPPFDRAGIERINAQMLILAADREGTAKRWFDSLHGEVCPEILDIVEVKKAACPKRYVTKNSVLAVAFAAAATACAFLGVNPDWGFFGSLLSFVKIAAAAVFAVLFLRRLLRVMRYRSPEKTVTTLSKCVLRALKQNGMLENRDARVAVRTDVRVHSVCSMLTGASAHDKKVFSCCMSEMLSVPDDPRYLLISTDSFGRNRYLSYACPSAMAAKKETVAPLVSALKASTGKFEPCYTRNDAGHRELLRCKKVSYINSAVNEVSGKKAVVCRNAPK